MKKINFKEFLIDTLFDIIGSCLFSLGVYYFASNADFAPGGITGLSMIINHFVPAVKIGLCTLLLNIPVILICMKSLGKEFLFKSIKTMIINAVVLDFVFPTLLPATYMMNANSEHIVAALFAGVLMGAGLALVYTRDSSTGGTDFIIFALRRKYRHLSMGTLTLIIDGIIIILGGITYGRIEALLLGIIMTAASTTVMDKVLYGFSSSKMTIIITEKGKEIAKMINEKIGRGATQINATGTFTGSERQMLMCACSKAEAVKVRLLVRSIDNHAIVMMSTVDEAYGLGFRDLDEQ